MRGHSSEKDFQACLTYPPKKPCGFSKKPPPAIAIFSQILAPIFIPKIRSITVQMGTPKAHLQIQFFFEILAAFFEFMHKKLVAEKSFCPRGQASNPPSPYVDKHGFFGNPPSPLSCPHGLRMPPNKPRFLRVFSREASNTNL